MLDPEYLTKPLSGYDEINRLRDLINFMLDSPSTLQNGVYKSLRETHPTIFGKEWGEVLGADESKNIEDLQQRFSTLFVEYRSLQDEPMISPTHKRMLKLQAEEAMHRLFEAWKREEDRGR